MINSARHWIFLTACLVFAAWLRVDCYPDTYYGDEEIPIAVVAHMQQKNSLDTNWKMGVWRKPTDRWAYSYDQYNFSSYNSTLYYLHQLIDGLYPQGNPAVVNRAVSVVFQLLTLTLIYFACRRLFGNAMAISATLFFVVNPLMVVDAHYARPESFLVFVVTLAIVLQLCSWREQIHRLLFPAALLWGIACACKFSLLPMAAVALFAAMIWQHQLRATLLCLPLFFLGAFVLAPYLFLHPDVTLHGIRALFTQYLGATSPISMSFEHSDWLLPKYLFVWFGLLSWPVMIASLFNADITQRKLAQLSWLVASAYIAFFSFTSFFNESNLSHLVFIWCLLFAFGTQTIIDKFPSPFRYSQSLLLALVLAMPAALAIMIQLQVYKPAAVAKREQFTAAYEQEVRNRCDHAELIDAMKQLDVIISEHPPQLVRTSWVPRYEYREVESVLNARHYRQVGELLLPLHALPHSQLQSIHFPAAYRYYCLHSDNSPSALSPLNTSPAH